MLLREADLLHPGLQPISHVLFRLLKGVRQFLGLFTHLGEGFVFFFNQFLSFFEKLLNDIIIKQLLVNVVEFPFLVFEVSELIICQLITLFDPFAK